MSLADAAIADLEADLDVARLELEEQRQYAVRYLTAYRSARQRADAVHQALVEADEERDYLRGRLRERDDEVAQLVAENADFKGLVR